MLDELLQEHDQKMNEKEVKERWKREADEADTAAQTKKKPRKTPATKKTASANVIEDSKKEKRILAITDYAKMSPAEQALSNKHQLVVAKPRKGTGKKKKGNGTHDPAVQFHDSKDDPYIARPKLPQKISD